MAVGDLSFAFDPSKNETPQTVARKRLLAEAILGNTSHAPRDIGEGLNSIGQALMYRKLMSGVTGAETAGNTGAAKVFGSLFGDQFPSAPVASSSSVDVPTQKVAQAAGDQPGPSNDYFSSIRTAESDGSDTAKNPKSSATGRYQFTTGTWGDVAQAHPELGLTPDGRLDPAQQEKAIRAFTADNANILSGAGIPTTGGNLYAAHFLGAGGAKTVLTQPDNASVAALVGPQVVKANPFLASMDVGQFKQWAAEHGGGNAPVDLGGGNPAGTQVASLESSAGMAPAGTPDPYGKIPAIDSQGQDQRAKFREWNSNPIANEASNEAAIDPALRGVIDRAKQIAGTDFVIGSGKRDPAMQQKAVDWGWSKTNESDHLGGGAADLWPVVNGQVVFDPQKQAVIVQAMKQAAKEKGVDLEAGADWSKFKDTPHFGMIGQTPMQGPIPTARPGDVQVASLDPSIGTAPDAKAAIARALAGQGTNFPPELGPQDVAAMKARPRPADAVPFNGPPELSAPGDGPQAYAPQQPATDAKQAILQALSGQGAPQSGAAPLPDQQFDARFAGAPPAGGPQMPVDPRQAVAQAMIGQNAAPAPVDVQTASTGPVAPPMPAPANPGAPQGPGAPGEIRKGADGKNYQYAQTTGMAGATGDQGWIETSMAAPDTQMASSAPVAPPMPQDVAQVQPGQAAPPLPPPTTVQDRPVASAPQPDLSQLPAMAGGNADVVAPGGNGPSVQQLMQAAGDPWVMQKYGPVVEALIQQKMKQGDPGYALDLAKKKMDLQLEQQQLGGAFRGDSIDAQAWNILQTRDPSSKEYQTAYSIVSQPKMQMVQTANGMVQVQVPPVLPGWLKAPGSAGGPAAAPDGAAPNTSQAAPGLAAPASSPAAAGAPPPGGTATASAPIPGTKQPATETQARNGAIGHILLNEVPTLGKTFQALADPKGQLLSATLGKYGNPWQSEDYQRAAASVKTSVANVLYSLSGASSNPDEVLKQIEVLTPAIGDKPGTIADKLNRFKTYVRSVSSEANDPELTKSVEEALKQMDLPATPDANASAGIATPKTDAEFNALPSGAIYTDPDDGKQYRKP